MRRPLRVHADAVSTNVGVGPIPVRTPLPHVPRAVVQPVPIRRVALHRRGAIVAVGLRVLVGEAALPDVRLLRIGVVGGFVAPHEPFADQPAAGCVLPLGFGRQSLAGPLRVGVRVVPRDVNDGVVVLPFERAVRSLGVLPTRAGNPPPPAGRVVGRHLFARRGEHQGTRHELVVRWSGRVRGELLLHLFPVGLLFRRRDIACSLDELSELGVGDLRFVHVEGGEPDPVRGLLVLVRGVARCSHLELTCGDQHHPHRRAGAGQRREGVSDSERGPDQREVQQHARPTARWVGRNRISVRRSCSSRLVAVLTSALRHGVISCPEEAVGGDPDRRPVPCAGHFPPPLSCSFFITASRLKLSAFCRGG